MKNFNSINILSFIEEYHLQEKKRYVLFYLFILYKFVCMYIIYNI